MDKCPCCDRGFERLEDFPLIQVVSFRLETPVDQLSYESKDWQTYIAPSEKAANPKVPETVLKLFKNAERNVVEHDGWFWRRGQSSARENGFFYERFQKVPIALPEQVKHYISKLESLVGKEVPVRDLLPPFERDRYFKWAFDLPDSTYALTFWEDEETKDKDSRRAQLCVLGDGPNLGSAGGPTLSSLAVIASLEYEGRVKR